MTPADLSLTVLHAVRSAVDDGALTVPDGGVPQSVKVERPRPGGRGDYASSVALSLARLVGRRPLDVAEVLRERLRQSSGLAAVDITGPGFLNFTLRDDAQQSLVRVILRSGQTYGWQAPTGERAEPRHRADVRAAVTADALRRILVSQGRLVRTGCAGAADPDWALLGVPEVRPDAPGGHGPGHLPTDIAPQPAPYTARELARRLGADAARWGLLSAAAHDHPRLGDELLHQHEGNPLFRVRYAHSRTRALLRNAEQLGFDSAAERHIEDGHTLAGLLGDHPAVLASAARHRAPDRVARHLEAVADALLDFQHTVLPLGDEKPSAAHRSRLALAEAAGTVLAGGLSLLGISAPDQI
ncbi:arginine--tRNA ligase [Streptomyces sp. ISL-36]|uniref:ArgS-related anticodon-binding protein NrtL n=1 Tax=Streptomyces sp. ISL-36 TaxID=2819182 RepID=UPI001BEB4771|nr:DALR anticodon-binding domain-containing protein [Streptomyces sp. ISL-36]MBT2439387.1 arginine--tRNA ligase [Streptomyces sp. ISL-36]